MAGVLIVLSPRLTGIGTARLEAIEAATTQAHLDEVGLLALAEFAGAIGLIVGLFWWPIGVAAAIGTFLYFLGAAIFHLRAGDKNIAPVVVLMLVSIAYIVLRLLSI